MEYVMLSPSSHRRYVFVGCLVTVPNCFFCRFFLYFDM
nr:MAG TPA: hypothetical protein [Caudoviricetes sp.]